MTDTKIYVELSEELQGVLADNALNIEDILNQANLDTEVTYGLAPYQKEDGSRSKDVVTIILATSVAVPAVAFAISHILKSLYQKPHFVEYYENIEMYDAKGKLLKDKDGRPIYKLVKRYELIEPQKQEQPASFEANFSWKNGLVLRFNTDKKNQDSAQE